VERDDVAVGEHEIGDILVVGSPGRQRYHRRCQGLRRVHFPRPAEDLLQERQSIETFGILRLIIKAPGEYPRILPVTLHHLLEITFNHRPSRRIVDNILAW
jgi:hypothetical protein